MPRNQADSDGTNILRDNCNILSKDKFPCTYAPRNDDKFYIPTLDYGECSASRSARFTPGERARGTHWTRDWIGLFGCGELEYDSAYPRSCQEPRPANSTLMAELSRLLQYFNIGYF